jgi:hypothetical protein
MTVNRGLALGITSAAELDRLGGGANDGKGRTLRRDFALGQEVGVEERFLVGPKCGPPSE